MNKVNRQNRSRVLDTDDGLTAVGGVGVGAWVERMKGLSKK